MNAEYHAAIDRLKKQIGNLISQYECIKADNERMALELSTSKTQLNEYTTTIHELEQKVNTLQLAEAFKASGTDAQEAKQKVTKLIKEIDKCIALLNT
ncbi:MAG: hypothetical protein FWE30_07670 [Bacteroidales bacterium]|nr:hypothetical protein [Bacteroidales bacterium]MCL2739309.1 hypothetical protein [Bacteroidales bacterium]